MNIISRFCDKTGLQYPIINAPMAFVAGGRLAAAVSQSGGMGLIGGGYGESDWINNQFHIANGIPVGIGFITWALEQRPELIEESLSHRPSAVLLSFGDPRPWAAAVHRANALLICQVQSLEHAKLALAAEADVIVAQGTEAGGHGGDRSTLPLVPEVRDLIDSIRPETILFAAGGIADGRGIAAALALGAEGVLLGTRFWATQESLAHPAAQQVATSASGDSTIRTSVVDLARGISWPTGYSLRAVKNDFITKWHGAEEELQEMLSTEQQRYGQARENGDYSIAATIVGEAVGLIRNVPNVSQIMETLMKETETAVINMAKKCSYKLI